MVITPSLLFKLSWVRGNPDFRIRNVIIKTCQYFYFIAAMEQLRTKEKYQVGQIKQNVDTSMIEKGSYSPGNSLLGENRLSSIKQVLQTNSKDIQQIVKDVNEVKRTLGI